MTILIKKFKYLINKDITGRDAHNILFMIKFNY